MMEYIDTHVSWSELLLFLAVIGLAADAIGSRMTIKAMKREFRWRGIRQ